MTSVLLLLGGFVLLVAGGESLVRGAAGLARAIGMSSLVVGLTVVSFATSSPELAVSAGAALTGSPGLAVGNVVGSNIANVLLVLGLSAVFVPLLVRSRVIRADIPVMVALSALFLLLALDGSLGRGDGALLLAALAGYVVVTVVLARRQRPAEPGGERAEQGGGAPRRLAWLRATRARSMVTDLLLVLLGVGLLLAGAQLLVAGATDIASALGVSDLVIGLTIVAVGTSLPELATSVVAALRGERELAVGNIVGSNIFNIGAVLGVTALIAPEGVEVAQAARHFDLPIMIAVAVALLPVAFTAQAVGRWEGGLFAVMYCAYVAYLLLAATEHAALGPFSAAMLWFVLPITALWLVALVGYEAGLRRGRREVDGGP